MSEPPKFTLFQRPFSKKKAPEPPPPAPSNGSGDSGPSEQPGVQASDETKKKVAAAKNYIENMYRVQADKIQERYAR